MSERSTLYLEGGWIAWRERIEGSRAILYGYSEVYVGKKGLKSGIGESSSTSKLDKNIRYNYRLTSSSTCSVRFTLFSMISRLF